VWRAGRGAGSAVRGNPFGLGGPVRSMENVSAGGCCACAEKATGIRTCVRSATLDSKGKLHASGTIQGAWELQCTVMRCGGIYCWVPGPRSYSTRAGDDLQDAIRLDENLCSGMLCGTIEGAPVVLFVVNQCSGARAAGRQIQYARRQVPCLVGGRLGCNHENGRLGERVRILLQGLLNLK
jgi:hypothetical protein